MSSVHINLKVDAALAHALRTYAAMRDMQLSAAVRDLLRQALAIAEPTRTGGWLEGRREAWEAVLAAIEGALAQVPEAPPEAPGA